MTTIGRIMAFQRESDLQSAAMRFLKSYGILHWRMPVGPVVHRFGKGSSVKEIWKKNPLKGFPDVAGVFTKKYPGRFFVLEFKTEKGRLTPEQEAWIDNLARAGCACGVVRKIDDLYDFFIANGEF